MGLEMAHRSWILQKPREGATVHPLGGPSRGRGIGGGQGPHACSMATPRPSPLALTCRCTDADVRTTVCFLFIGHYLDTARPAS